MPKFVPRQRKHKVLARQKIAGDGDPSTAPHVDANASQIIPLSKDEKELKRQKLRDELRAGQPKMSAKKQKRLDKYIENKLKKDENIDLIRKLEKEKEKWDARGLISSKNFKKRGFDEFVTGQVDAVPSHEVVEAKQNAKRGRQEQEQNEEEDDVASEDSFEAEHQEAFTGEYVPESDEAWTARRAPPAQGTGLAQPLQMGLDGLPIIQTRTNKKRKKKVHETDSNVSPELVASELPWEDFDSEPDNEAELSNSEDDSNSNPDSNEDDETDDEDEDSEDYTEEDSEGNSDSDASASATSQEQVKIKPRASAFKTWATQQLNQAIGHTPSYAENGGGELVPNQQSHKPSTTSEATNELINLVNGLPEVKAPTVDRRIYSVQVRRPEVIQESRVQLPILQKEQEIMEAIHANAVVVIKGDTGSGKTTQLPQFLYEAGYGDPNGPTPGLIGVTQPRRVAAVSMAKRVGEELGDHGGRVAHQIRFDSSVSSNTAIKFMTDGILLRELSQDLLLKKYSAIIIDEAHERSVNTDILIGMLSKIVPARARKDKYNPKPQPLKLIIMSATLNIEDFLHDKLFASSLRPPIVEAEGRQHRVTTHFALRSRGDYLEEVIEKVKRAHRKLPKGGMLVFLTGQMEIKQVQNRLRKELKQSNTENSPSVQQSKMRVSASEIPIEIEDIDFGTVKIKNQQMEDEDEINILTHSDEEAEEREFDVSDDEEDEPASQTNGSKRKSDTRDPYDSVHVLPLYSQLPTKEQLRVFDPPPERSRLIVLATNVAETSLTIPGIRYVFDCGRSKERKYNLGTGVQSFEIDYISKASAQQRAGRAGRTGPGHCWRLYSSAVYEQCFPAHTQPEILRAPAESVVLQIKGFAYPKPVVEFPFPTAPTLQTIDKAEKLLRNLGALTSAGLVTDTGKELSNYPLSPRLGKMLASITRQPEVVANTIFLVAGLAVGDIYVNNATALNQDDEDDYQKEEHDKLKQKYGRAQATLTKHDKTSDAMKMITAISMYIEAPNRELFCEQYFLKSKAMNEVALLVQQLVKIIAAHHSGLHIPSIASTTPQYEKHGFKTSRIIELCKKTNKTAASGYVDQVAIRWDCAPNPPTLPFKPRRAIDVPYFTLTPLQTSSSGASSADVNAKAVFIHPSSLLARLAVKDLPQYIVYTHLQQSQSRVVGTDTTTKTRMHPLTPIDATSLISLAHDTPLVEYGKPVPKMEIKDLVGAAKRSRWCWVTSTLRASSAGGYGWPMPPVKVRQVLDVKSPTGWRVEEVMLW